MPPEDSTGCMDGGDLQQHGVGSGGEPLPRRERITTMPRWMEDSTKSAVFRRRFPAAKSTKQSRPDSLFGHNIARFEPDFVQPQFSTMPLFVIAKDRVGHGVRPKLLERDLL